MIQGTRDSYFPSGVVFEEPVLLYEVTEPSGKFKSSVYECKIKDAEPGWDIGYQVAIGSYEEAKIDRFDFLVKSQAESFSVSAPVKLARESN